MKVLNLKCAGQHLFEGWFGSEDDFQSQLKRGLLTCPMCSSSDVQKTLSAPRLNLSGATAPVNAGRAQDEMMPVSKSLGDAIVGSNNHVVDACSGVDADTLRPAQAAFLTAVRQLMKNSEDVGDRFAREARRMHEGDTPFRSIRGQANERDAQALRDDGIDVISFPLPAALKETLQ